MDQEFDIEIQNSTTTDTSGVQLPLNFLTFGTIESDDVKVYIKQDVYKALEKLAASDTSKEIGSILLGTYCQEHGKTHVIISQYIEAKYTDASAATLTFTHETWDYIHSEHKKRYPYLKIIGWQHTHPSYGIFLSNYDLFIQENFFNLPFQIAYVIDPIQNLRGFFQWKNGRIEKLAGYYIYDNVGKPVKIEQVKTPKQISAPGWISKGAIVLIAMLLAVMLCLSFLTVSVYQKYTQQVNAHTEILSHINRQQEAIQKQNAEIAVQKEQIDQQNALIQNQSEAIGTLQTLLINSILDSTGQTTAECLIQMLENHTLTTPDQESLIPQLKAFLEPDTEEVLSDNPVVIFRAYTVVAGDSLTTICAAHNLDYYASHQIILAINGIDNADQIYVGQTILLPVAG